MPCLRDRATRWSVALAADPAGRGRSSRVGIVITHWDEVEGPARAGHIAAPGSRSRVQLDHRGRTAHLGRAGPLGDAVASRGLGGGDLLRPLGHGVLVPGRGRRRSARSRSGRATASSTSRSSTRTRSAPATTGSSCSPSASGTTPRTRCCLAPACRGSARPGCSRGRRRIIRGRARRRRAPTWDELSERPARVVNLADVPRSNASAGTVG